MIAEKEIKGKKYFDDNAKSCPILGDAPRPKTSTTSHIGKSHKQPKGRPRLSSFR